MSRYNQWGIHSYNDLGKSLYNQFGRAPEDSPEQRLAGASLIVLDQRRQTLAILDQASEIMLTQEMNGADSLEFVLPFHDPKAVYLRNENIIKLIGEEYVIRKIIKSREDSGMKTIWVYAEADWYNLQYAAPLEVAEWEDVKPGIPMRDILEGTGWRVGKIDVQLNRNLTLDLGLTNRLKALREVSDLWGGALIFRSRTKTVDLIAHEYEDPGIAIIYRKNMKSLEAEYDTQDLITRLYPYGKNGMTIADANEFSEYIENFQYTNQVRVRSFKDNRFTNPYHLKEKAEEILDKLSVPRASYKISASDLSHLAGLEHEYFKLGDLVNVFDAELEVNLKTQIVKWKYNILEPWNTQLELASIQPGLEELLRSVSEVASNLQSEDTVNHQDMLNLMVFNYILNSRAENGDAYWVNNGWTIDPEFGYSGEASFRCEGSMGVAKTLSQKVYPSHRDQYTLSLRASTSELTKGENARIGVEIEIKYTDGTSDVRFLAFA
ncbi:phage tail protein [Bacillus horti]|uniref:Phage minor structural protein n=1 Tax=Caldalkalibacillus horti TaxID=77523 RepID=A0ABT9W5B8_9BACI|nr:phage tail protein [Bacillus horti]MDQ0168443.1 phage minor structural protein [Bacillus horti]